MQITFAFQCEEYHQLQLCETNKQTNTHLNRFLKKSVLFKGNQVLLINLGLLNSIQGK